MYYVHRYLQAKILHLTLESIARTYHQYYSRLVCVHALKGKWLGLSIPNLVNIDSMAVTWYALRSKGQGHTFTKCAAGVGMHVDTAVSFPDSV